MFCSSTHSIHDVYCFRGTVLAITHMLMTYKSVCRLTLTLTKNDLLHALKLHDGKTAGLRFISKHNNTTFGTAVSCSVSVRSNNVIPASRVRIMGVIMDQQLSMIDQVTAVCANRN